GDLAQHLGFFFRTDVAFQLRMAVERAFSVPLVQQEPRRLFVKLYALARQFLVAVKYGHHRQQQRIARQLADGRRIADRTGQTRFFGRTVANVVVGRVVPAVEEVVDLWVVQILQQKVAKLGVGQTLRFITDHSRRDDHTDLRILIAEIVDVVDDL